MRRITAGILAHVDSGKTTLSEAMLFESGRIRKQGRVDHKDSFLDNNAIERDRGITIFSKQAELRLGDHTCLTLLDTPGHVDFCAETERTLAVLDCAILVISASDGVQSHTETLWHLLEGYGLPVFLFVNKMDLEHRTKAEIMDELRTKFGGGCIEFSPDWRCDANKCEEIAVCDDGIMEKYLEDGAISDANIRDAVAARRIFPCIFGSALKNNGVADFMRLIELYSASKSYRTDFGAKVYKISEDDRGTRLTHMKITGGTLCVKEIIGGVTDGEQWSEKINEIRIYSGAKYESEKEVESGTVCAVTGLERTYAGQGLGFESDSAALTLEPVFSYRVKILDDTSDSAALMMLKKLGEEETQLNVVWNPHLRQIGIELMGGVQLEVLRRIIDERFGIKAEFEQSGIVYKETISGKAEGVGHYEPLRHYAEVHLLLEQGKPGSGLNFASRCRDDELDINWQRLVLTHLKEKTHLGVLTGSPITDMNITLVSGRAHIKHTDGGDFRQATYRAVRQGLRSAQSVLLEPWFDFVIDVPCDNIGRVMSDITRMDGRFEPPMSTSESARLIGSAPVAAIRDYQSELVSFTRGMGRMTCRFRNYEPCRNAKDVIDQIGYDCDADVDNTADSVFCSHGASVIVKWDEVCEHMHLPSVFAPKSDNNAAVSANVRKKFDPTAASDEELNKIFERTFGKPRENVTKKQLKKPSAQDNFKSGKSRKTYIGPEYLLVDAYNIIFAWESLKAAAADSIDLARTQLINRLINYRAVKGCELIAVFDAYKVKGGTGSIESVNGISIVYTKEAETADTYIERVSHELAKNHLVRVATSDGPEQMIIVGNGALRLSASAFEKEIEAVERSIEEYLSNS